MEYGFKFSFSNDTDEQKKDYYLDNIFCSNEELNKKTNNFDLEYINFLIKILDEQENSKKRKLVQINQPKTYLDSVRMIFKMNKMEHMTVDEIIQKGYEYNFWIIKKCKSKYSFKKTITDIVRKLYLKNEIKKNKLENIILYKLIRKDIS